MLSHPLTLRHVQFILFLIQFFIVRTVYAEAANVTIAAACTQGVLSGSQCPTPAPVCTDEPENSTDTLLERQLGCQTLGEATLGNERSCLDQRRVPANARIAASDLNHFVQRCDFIVKDQYLDVADLTCVSQAQNRDAQINNFFQNLAGRSVVQINCRLDAINQYFQNPQNLSPTPKAKLNAAAKAKFNEVRTRIRGLLFSKQKLLAKANARALPNLSTCMGMGCGAPMNALNNERDRINQNYEAAIAAEASKVPFGYEPDVATTLVAMAQDSDFNENSFEAAMFRTFKKYEGLRSYYDQRATKSGTGIRYCIDREFKEYATSTGVVGQLLDAYPPSIMTPTARDIVRCRLESKYRTVGEHAQTASNIAFMVGGGAAALLTAIPTAGSSLATYGAVASLGLSVASFSYQVQQANKACHTRNFLISPTGGEQCNAQQDFEKEVSQLSLSSCMAQSGMAALQAIPIIPGVMALARSTRAVGAIDEIEEAITEATRAENAVARGQRVRSNDRAQPPRVRSSDVEGPARAARAGGSPHPATSLSFSERLESGAAVIVPRTDGGFTPGRILRMDAENATVQFEVGGRAYTKVVRLSELQPLRRAEQLEVGNSVSFYNSEGNLIEGRIRSISRERVLDPATGEYRFSDTVTYSVSDPRGHSMMLNRDMIGENMTRAIDRVQLPTPILGVNSQATELSTRILPRPAVSSRMNETIQNTMNRYRAVQPSTENSGVLEFTRLTKTSPPELQAPLARIYNRALNTRAWDEWTENLLYETANDMQLSGRAEWAAAAARGEISRNDILRTLVRRSRQSGRGPISSIRSDRILSEPAFSERVRSGPFFDKGNPKAGDISHGVDSHFIQQSFLSDTVRAEWPGGERAFYEYLGQNAGRRTLWNYMFDMGPSSRVPTSPGFVLRRFADAGIDMR